jgi:tetratricopeptide (TPR) repeat protein
VLGGQHPNTLMSMNNLAVAYLSEGKYAQAEPLYTTIADSQRHILGETHPSTLLSLNNLAALYRYERKYGPAEALYKSALDGRRQVLGAENPDTLVSMNDLALLYLDQGRHAEAGPIFAKVLEIRRRKLGPEHPATAGTASSLGRVRLAQRNDAEAEALFREALGGLEKSSPETWGRYNCESLLGASLMGQGRYQEAEPLLLTGFQGLSRHESAIPWGSRFFLAQAGERIVRCYEDWGRPDKAAEWRERVGKH